MIAYHTLGWNKYESLPVQLFLLSRYTKDLTLHRLNRKLEEPKKNLWETRLETTAFGQRWPAILRWTWALVQRSAFESSPSRHSIRVCSSWKSSSCTGFLSWVLLLGLIIDIWINVLALSLYDSAEHSTFCRQTDFTNWWPMSGRVLIRHMRQGT